MVRSPRRATRGGGAPEEGAAHAPRRHHPPPCPRPPSRGPPRLPVPRFRHTTTVGWRDSARPVAFSLRPGLLLPTILLYLAPPRPPLAQSRRINKPSNQSSAYAASRALKLHRFDRKVIVVEISMVPRDTVNAAVGRSLVQGSVINNKCEKKAPKKIHKSEREKRKRGTQNDLFSELGAMLEPDRQNSGKACVLGDTTRILKDLVSQVESLRKENVTLKNESHYVVLERNELRDDNSMLRSEILELHNKLRARHQSDPIWSQDSTRSALTASYPTSRVFPAQHPPHLPVITATTLPVQPAPPRELQLFPEVSSASTEHSELSQDQGLSNSVTRPQARYLTPAVVSSSVNQFPILPRIGEDQQYSGTSEEHGLHRV